MSDEFDSKEELYRSLIPFHWAYLLSGWFIDSAKESWERLGNKETNDYE
jgi:hypothetical protein